MNSGRMRGFDPVPTSSRERAGPQIVLLAISIVCFAFAQSAHAEVRVSGGADAVMIETRDATLEEVLRALQASFKFRYRSTRGLDRVINGTYSGSLPRAVTRLLEGHNYVMQSSPNDLEVVIFVPGNPAQVTVPTGPAPLKECEYNFGGRVIPVEC